MMSEFVCFLRTLFSVPLVIYCFLFAVATRFEKGSIGLCCVAKQTQQQIFLSLSAVVVWLGCT